MLDSWLNNSLEVLNPNPVGIEEFTGTGKGPWITGDVEIDELLDTGGKLGETNWDIVGGISFWQLQVQDEWCLTGIRSFLLYTILVGQQSCVSALRKLPLNGRTTLMLRRHQIGKSPHYTR